MQRALAEIWQRPVDMIETLKALSNDARWSQRLDFENVGAVGFFLGGSAALSLAGAELDAERYMRSCDEGGRAAVDCAWFAEGDVSLRDLDPAVVSRSHAFPALKVAIAVDPELATSYARDSLREIALPVDVITLQSQDAVNLAAAIPNARHHMIAGATHFSAFALCRPRAVAILEEEGESSAICTERDGQNRAEIQERLGDLIASRLSSALDVVQ
jgi:predicted dienelactone hydrolase